MVHKLTLLWRLALSALVLLCTSPNALAEEKKETPQYVEFAGVPFAIVEDGKIVQYVFVSFRMGIVVPDVAHTVKIYNARPYIRDAIIRSSYKSYLGNAGQPGKLDKAKMNAVIKEAWTRHLGAKDMGKIMILDVRPGPPL
jgi:hypothetical protein